MSSDGTRDSTSSMRVAAKWPRVWNSLAGSNDNYESDREFAEVLEAEFRHLDRLVEARLKARRRVTEYLAGTLAVTQFVVLGTDVPLHVPQHLPAKKAYAAEVCVIVREINPAALTVYATTDRLVDLHVRALLCTDPGWGCRSVFADGDPASVLAAAIKELDASSPIAVVVIGALEDMDDEAARAAIRDFDTMLPPRSHLAVVHLTASVEVAVSLHALCALHQVPAPHLRSPEEITALLGDGLPGGEVRVIVGEDPHVSEGLAMWSVVARIGGAA